MKNYIAALFQNKELDGKPLDHWGQIDINNKVLENNTWKERLSEKEYQVLRDKGTEAPHSSVYDKHLPKKGHYACRACGNPLYSFKHKFESGCGWPAFGKFVKGSIETRDDFSLRVRRTEIVCSRCEGHLGHVFAENNTTKEDSFTERHCVNGISIRYVDMPLPEEAQEQSKLF